MGQVFSLMIEFSYCFIDKSMGANRPVHGSCNVCSRSDATNCQQQHQLRLQSACDFFFLKRIDLERSEGKNNEL